MTASLSSGPDFRFASSDFSKDKNRLLWQNVLTQELAHRYGSFLTADKGNPLKLLGRAMAHWGVFYDAGFSPLDGNDWKDNNDGTFTLEKSYLDEAAFKRSEAGMPFNDLDLYSMGLLDASQVRNSFVIENPTLTDGRKLRMHSSGNLVEIQNADNTWSGPYYLSSDTVIRGTRRTISLQDIVALEGPRNPPAAASQKDFKVAFVNLSNNEGEAAVDVLEQSQKLSRFKDSFTRFFKEMARNLGNVLFPQGQARLALSAQKTVTNHALAGNRPTLNGDDRFFVPLDTQNLRYAGFEEALSRMLPVTRGLGSITQTASTLLSNKPLLVQGLEKVLNIPNLSLITTPLQIAASTVQKPVFQEIISFKESTNPRIFPTPLDKPTIKAGVLPPVPLPSKIREFVRSVTPQIFLKRTQDKEDTFSNPKTVNRFKNRKNDSSALIPLNKGAQPLPNKIESVSPLPSFKEIFRLYANIFPTMGFLSPLGYGFYNKLRASAR